MAHSRTGSRSSRSQACRVPQRSRRTRCLLPLVSWPGFLGGGGSRAGGRSTSGLLIRQAESTRISSSASCARIRTHSEHLATGWHVFKSITGRDGTGAWAPWLRREWLDQPSFQVLAQRSHAHAEAKAGLPSEIEFFLNDTVGEEWVFRRDTSVRVALQRLTVTASVGVQVLAPEVQLLHKAKSHRPRDEHDFARVLPHLDRARLVWLHSQLSRHLPGDPWLVSLEASLMSRP